MAKKIKKVKATTGKKPGRVLIIDGQNWAHRAFHAQGNLSFGDKKIGLIYGFINMLHSLVSRFPKPKAIYVCFDHGRDQRRLDILPDYKNREKKIDFDRESFEYQIKGLRRTLITLGIPCLYSEMTEADDSIYVLQKKYHKTNMVVIASGDKDFRQLVKKNVTISDEKYGRITTKNFEELFQIRPDQYADFLGLWGDASDKIPGVTGVGEKTAIKILKDWDTWAKFNELSIDTIKRRQSIEIYERNRLLINLEAFHEKFGENPLKFYKDKSKPKFNEEKYIAQCKKYGLKKFRTEEFITSLKRGLGVKNG